MTFLPFFVTGSPKSGTTWLGKLLDAHPEVTCRGEALIPAFTSPLARLCGEYNEILEKRAGRFSEANDYPPLGEPELLSLMRHFVELRMAAVVDPSKSSVKCQGEKDPTLSAILPLLHKMFPEGKVIHIIRDGRAVILSAWHHNLRIADGRGQILMDWDHKNPGAKAVGFDAFLDQAAGRWAAFVRTARANAHVLGDRYMEVRYEDLSSDILPQLKRVLDHLGVDTREEIARACAESASFENLSQGRNRGEEDSKSFFRKGLVDDWKNHMTPAQISRCNARSGGMLQELGYLD